MVVPSRSTLADFTAPELLFPALEVNCPSEAVRCLCDALKSSGKIVNSLNLYHAALNREMLGGTTSLDGWAIPHGRVAEDASLAFALGKPAQPLRWFDGTSVRLVFMCAVPGEDSGEYLHLIAGIARLSNDASQSEALMNARKPGEMLAALRQATVRPRASSRAAAQPI